MPDTLHFIGVLSLIKMHSGICLHFAKVVERGGGDWVHCSTMG